ncbi:hypothetical protein ERJ75_000038100 [Trypanosoma vivax]|uniref:Uncharacterized protein n=1 Tax=Trypanosoma vivax (strain Y486) TaxID=1055687 RepID=G0U7L5_TRYVY|nr:hypothetical protein TRVL_01467 [Trypanosoma vivax]KAH8620490.1 hypothetical protein ERJ75_000038100 [Trypanosoma vivax]CCC51873.1 conserved hypothetical protein [Trypanosoma vivax Y486]
MKVRLKTCVEVTVVSLSLRQLYSFVGVLLLFTTVAVTPHTPFFFVLALFCRSHHPSHTHQRLRYFRRVTIEAVERGAEATESSHRGVGETLISTAMVCLILLTGLPGAGKTSLALALKRLVDGATGSDGRIVLEAVVELDAFMPHDGNECCNTVKSAFSPKVWREACVAAREATRQALLRSMRCATDNNGSIRLVVLVDTLPYRSMRATYWKLCKSLATDSNGEGSGKCVRCGMGEWSDRLCCRPTPIAMLVVHLNTPLELCLERNERRRDTESYIPPYVIKGMNENFDCEVAVARLNILGAENSWVLAPRHTNTPWPVLQLKSGDNCASLSPEQLARELLTRIVAPDVARELEEQRATFAAACAHRIAEKKRCRVAAASNDNGCGDWLHQMDLHMRAVVRQYILELKAAGTLPVRAGECASKCRERYLARLRAVLVQRRQEQHGSNSFESYAREILAEFHEHLRTM